MVDHFSSHFKETHDDRHRSDEVSFRSLLEEDNANITAPFLIFEIDRGVVVCDGNKSPGPDGFNFSFFKKFWPLLIDVTSVMFDLFHQFSTPL